MPLFMDRHEGLGGITPEEAAEAHMQDLEVQARYGVRYLSYWLDPQRGTVFCLADAPSEEAAEKVHRESHGLVAAKIIEVDRRMVESILGSLYEPSAGELWSATAFRVVAFTDIQGSTRLTQELGDALAMELLRDHDRIVREELVGGWRPQGEAHRGRHHGLLYVRFPGRPVGRRCAAPARGAERDDRSRAAGKDRHERR